MNCFVMHIPKTGGTSLYYALLQVFNRPFIGASWTMNPGLKGVNLATGDNLFWGHWPASVFYRLPEDTLKVTLLRDPIDRIISHYNYVHIEGYHRDAEYTAFCLKASFREWMVSDYAYRVTHNLMTRFFCDRLEANLEWALESLADFDVVGILEEDGLAWVVATVCERVGFDPRQIKIGRYRQSVATVTRADLTDSWLEELQANNQLDCALLEAVRMKNHENIASR